MSVYPNTGCHAVLALLSEGYPPLKGRSPTRYSPVCHSTHGLLHFRVRLACVRHAASVDSEPGSNSQVKVVRLRAARFGETCVAPLRNVPAKLVQPNRLLIWLSDSFHRRSRLRSSSGGPFKSCGVVNSALILDGLCLHVLSSFQRPEPCLPSAPRTNSQAPPHSRPGRPEGNLATLR